MTTRQPHPEIRRMVFELFGRRVLRLSGDLANALAGDRSEIAGQVIELSQEA